MLDTEFVRGHFRALDTPWILLDNAGGSAPCDRVVDRVRAYMERLPVQHGASYALSRDAGEAVAQGRAAAAELFGGEPNEMVLGPSSTALVGRIARCLRPLWDEGDEIVVTNLDHESNIGAWRALERTGIQVREWRFRPETAELHLEDLEPLLTSRTRLVAFTHVSNVVGTVHDVPAICARIRDARALSCVDGVAYAPHRRVDVKALGADLYFASLYKIYGPHIAAMWGRADLLREAASENHDFVPADAIPEKLEPGGTPYELVASIAGIVEYLRELGRHHELGDEPSLDDVFARIAGHEYALSRPLLNFLDEHPRATIVGRADGEPDGRVSTIAFTVEGRKSSEIPPLLDAHRVAVRYGHFYSLRAIRDLGLLERDGIVRASFVHYNTREEVERLLELLDEIL